jgi:prophage regulatory protein
MLKTKAGDVIGSGEGPPLRLVRKHELKEICGYSWQHLSRLERQGRFPRRVVLGPCGVAWVYSEVLDWVRDRIRERDQEATTS